MFDRTVLFQQAPPSHATDVRVTVTEKRAPTDESVKLLREMEQAARNSVLVSRNLENNVLSGHIEVIRDPLVGPLKYNLYAAIKLNNQNFEFSVPLNASNPLPDGIDMATALVDAVAEGIAVELIKQGLHKSVIEMIESANREKVL